MEKEFGVDRIQIVEMPHGLPVNAENYAEFGRALEALASTRSFNEKVVAEARQIGKPVVYVEGETDEPYLKHAAAMRQRMDILAKCDIRWIGAKNEGGQAFYTGAAALKSLLTTLRAQPRLTKHNILLLHDNDSTTPDQDYEGVFVRRIPKNPENKKIKVGIENLLPETCLEARFWDEKEETKDDGEIIMRKKVRKTDLCAAMCLNQEAENFSNFDEVFAMVDDFLSRAAKVD